MNSVGGVIGLPITNHPFDALTLAQGGPLTFHFSPVTNPQPLTSHQSLLTNHGRGSGLAVCFQDLFLAFS
jgi:hypothetical protein